MPFPAPQPTSSCFPPPHPQPFMGTLLQHLHAGFAYNVLRICDSSGAMQPAERGGGARLAVLVG